MMNGSVKNKLILTLIIALLLCNAVTIVLFWTNRQPGPPPHPQGPASFITRELELDKGQQERYQKMVTAHQRGSESFKRDIREAKDELYQLMQQPGVTDSTIDAAVQKVAGEMAKLERFNFDHFHELRKICQPAQQQKFDAIIRKVLDMMRPGPPGHGPRH
jgi:Spy/CpxP family protein refolding chaperone